MGSRITGWIASILAFAKGCVKALAGKWSYCSICERRTPAFYPWRGGSKSSPPLMRELNAIGSNVDFFSCPFCGCSDRERHLKLFMMNTGISKQLSHADVLHFAPEKQLGKWIASLGPARYILADIAPKSEDMVRIDIESIPYADESFDFVIANHVLEHVDNLDASTQEIARVLKPGGKAILQTPWCKGIETTIEDKTVVSPGARLHLYGQDDHVRLFGRDVFSRISGNWLKPEIVEHYQALAQYSTEKYGLNEKEPFMLFVKP